MGVLASSSILEKSIGSEAVKMLIFVGPPLLLGTGFYNVSRYLLLRRNLFAPLARYQIVRSLVSFV